MIYIFFQYCSRKKKQKKTVLMQYWYSTVILLFFISLFLSWNSTVIFSIFLIECEVLLRVVTIDSNKIMQFAIKNFQEDKT